MMSTLGACVTTRHHVTASGEDLSHHLTELRSVGSARVQVQDVGGTYGYYRVRADRDVTVRGVRRPLASLLAGCDQGATSPDCLLTQLGDDPILLEDSVHRRVDGKAFGFAGAMLVVSGIVAYGICDGTRCDSSPRVNRATEIAGITSASVAGAGIVYLLVECFVIGGCRD